MNEWGSGLQKELVSVEVAGERITQEVFVDSQTGLDIDPHSGVFRTRDETLQLIREIYEVGRVSMRSELDRYNKWVREGVGRKDPLAPDSGPLLRRVKGPQASSNVAEAERLKALANGHFSSKRYHHALLLYRRAAGITAKAVALSRGPVQLRLRNTLSVIWSNAAEANIRLGRHEDGLTAANAALDADPHNDKALYRAAVCALAVGDRKQAARHFAIGSKAVDTPNTRAAVLAQWESLAESLDAADAGAKALPATAAASDQPPTIDTTTTDELEALYDEFGYF